MVHLPLRHTRVVLLPLVFCIVSGCGREAPSGTGRRTASAAPASQSQVTLSRAKHGLGTVGFGTSHAVTINVRNNGAKEVTLKPYRLPRETKVSPAELKIPAGGSLPLTITVRAPKEPGAFASVVNFRTSEPGNPTLPFRATGIAVAKPPRNAGGTAAGSHSTSDPKPSKTGPHPTLTFEKVRLDAGTVRKGKPAEYTFKLKNSGKGEGIISVKPGCGCTVTKYDEKIPPGKTGTIRATLNTTSYRGEVTKPITVKTNDPDHASYSLNISAEVIPSVEVLPSNRAYLTVYEGESTTHEFSLYSNERTPLVVKSVKESSGKLKTELIAAKVPVKGKEGQTKPGYRLRVTVPSNLPPRPFASTLTVETNLKQEPTVAITVSCKVQQEITVSPSTLYLVIRDDDTKKYTRTLTASKRTGTFKITKVDVRKQPLKATVTPLVTGTDGTSYRVQFEYLGGWKPGFVNSVLHIHTDNKKQPIIDVPLTASVVAPVKKN